MFKFLIMYLQYVYTVPIQTCILVSFPDCHRMKNCLVGPVDGWMWPNTYHSDANWHFMTLRLGYLVSDIRKVHWLIVAIAVLPPKKGALVDFGLLLFCLIAVATLRYVRSLGQQKQQLVTNVCNFLILFTNCVKFVLQVVYLSYFKYTSSQLLQGSLEKMASSERK